MRIMGAGASRDRLKMSVGKLLEEDVPDPAENPEVRLQGIDSGDVMVLIIIL